MDVEIAVKGSRDPRGELFSLRQCLIREDEYRGKVEFPPVEIREGDLGAVQELLTVALAAGSFNALCQTISVWIQSRHSELEVEVKHGDGSSTRISVKGGITRSVSEKLDLSE